MKKILAIMVAILLLTGCSAQQPSISKETVALDTVIKLSLYNTEDTSLLDDCFQIIREYENLFSRTIKTSDITHVNSALGEWVKVSEETAELLTKAQEISVLSKGSFDITVAPIMDVWNFKSETTRPPSAQKISELLPLVNYNGVVVQGNKVKLTVPGAAVDLGGIAKGYVADRLTVFLKEKGVTDALIDLGGNIYALGTRNGKPWRVGIQDPQNATALAAVVEVSDCSVVTSGVYERGFEYDGTRYHHIIDPKTGFPAQNELLSVTIVSKNSMECDALATACFVLGKEKGLALIESLSGIEALFIEKDGTLTATKNLSYTESK